MLIYNDVCAAGFPYFGLCRRRAVRRVSSQQKRMRSCAKHSSAAARNREMCAKCIGTACLWKMCRIAQTVLIVRKGVQMAVVRMVLAAISYGTEQALLLGQWARVGCILAPLRLSCCAVASFKITQLPVLETLPCVRCGVRCSGAVWCGRSLVRLRRSLLCCMSGHNQ
jgi:hypothetical protein